MGMSASSIAESSLIAVATWTRITSWANSLSRIFGMSLERNNPGVVIDTLGIPGARASTQLLWNEALQREHMQRRKPNLVVLAYGTNETGDDDQPIDTFDLVFFSLAVGPSDFELVHLCRRAEAEVQPQIALRVIAPPARHLSVHPPPVRGAIDSRPDGVTRAFSRRRADQPQRQPMARQMTTVVAQQ